MRLYFYFRTATPKDLTGFLFWTIVIDVLIIKGPRAGAARSKACGEVKTSVKQEAPPSIGWSSSLGHPTGKAYGSREGYPLNME
jgi:hypothetical protein